MTRAKRTTRTRPAEGSQRNPTIGGREGGGKVAKTPGMRRSTLYRCADLCGKAARRRRNGEPRRKLLEETLVRSLEEILRSARGASDGIAAEASTPVDFR